MTDALALENRIGSALMAAHLEMQMSDANEGLSYMHEKVEELRQFGNPWNNLNKYFKIHFDVSSFLFHLGCAEFKVEELKRIHSKVWDDYNIKIEREVSGSTMIEYQQEELSLKEKFRHNEKLKERLGNPTQYSDNVDMILNLSPGAYIVGGNNLVKAARAANQVLNLIGRIEERLDDEVEFKTKHLRNDIEKLEKYEKKNLGFFDRVGLLCEDWFTVNDFGMDGVMSVLMGDLSTPKRMLEDKLYCLQCEAEDINTPHFEDEKLKVDELWGKKLQHNGFTYPEFLSDESGLMGTTEQSNKKKYAVSKSELAVVYFLAGKVKLFRPKAEKKFAEYCSSIKEEYGLMVKKIFDAQQNIRAALEFTRREISFFQNRARAAEVDSYFASKRQSAAYNHPWICDHHPTFNTSAYSAKLVNLSAQLEAAQKGISSPLRLTP